MSTTTEQKQECTLPDVQNRQDTRGIALERVGLTNVKFPMEVLRKDGSTSQISAKVKLFADLPEMAKGHNLSRFSEVLVEFGETHKTLSSSTLPLLLQLMQTRLGSKDVFARFEFDYYIEKEAPASKKKAPMGYVCAFTGIEKDGQNYFILEVNVVAASVCPCSREMSLAGNLDSFESTLLQDADALQTAAGKNALSTTVGMGAHNQRSLIKVDLLVDTKEILWIEDVIAFIEAEASAPTFPILKRPDEKFVTELGYNNPKFSEDIARDVQLAIEREPLIKEWSLKVENEESIHPYNVTVVTKSKNWKFH